MNLKTQKIFAWPICLIFLVGIIFTGHSNVLCIGEKGQVKFEILCLPDCGEIDKTANSDTSCELQTENSDCSDCSDECSDIEYDNSLWSKRIQDNNLIPITKISILAFNADTIVSPVSDGFSNSQITKFHLAYGQSPPIYIISTAVLRC